MLVDKDIFGLWAYKYGKYNQIKRFGIQDEDGETKVEIYLKKFNLYPIPNSTLFKFNIREDEPGIEAFTQPIYMPKNSTV